MRFLDLKRIVLPLFFTICPLQAQKWGYTVLLGGQGIDRAQAVATDALGVAYVAGDTTSPDLPVTPNAYQPTCGSNALCNSLHDIFVTRINPDGTKFLAVTYLGGSGDEAPTAIAPGPGGSIFVAGFTTSPDFPWTYGPFGPCSEVQCAFLAKFDPSATRLEFAIPLPRVISVLSVAADSDGNIWMSGQANPGMMTKGPQLRAQLGGPFVAKLTPDAHEVLLFTYALAFEDRLSRVRTDNVGNIYLCGTVTNSSPPITLSTDAAQKSRVGTTDAVLMQLDTSGSLRYATYWGGEGSDQLLDCEIDPSGRLTVALTESTAIQIASFDLAARQVAYQRDFPVSARSATASTDGTVWFLNGDAAPLIYFAKPFGDLETLGKIGENINRCCSRPAVAAAPDGSLLFADLAYYDLIPTLATDAPQQWKTAAADAYIQRISASPPLHIFPASVKFTSLYAWETANFTVAPASSGPTDVTLLYKVWSDQPWIKVPSPLFVFPASVASPNSSGFRAEVGRESPDGVARGTIFIQREGSSDPPLQIPVEFNRISPTSPRVTGNQVGTLTYTIGNAYQPTIAESTTRTFASDVSWMRVQKAGNKTTVTLEPLGLAPGFHQGMLASTEGNVTTKVDYFLQVIPPRVWMTPAVFAFYRPGSSMENLTGEIGMDPQWQDDGFGLRPSGLPIQKIESSEPWLKIDKAASTLPGRINYSIQARGLSPGRYAATITIRCPGISWSTNITLLVGDDVPFTVSPISIAYQVPSEEMLAMRQIHIESRQPQTFTLRWDPSGASRIVPVFRPMDGNSLPASSLSATAVSPSVVNLYADAKVNSNGNDPQNLRLEMNGNVLMLPVAYVHGMTSPKATAIVNAASFDPSPIAPGSLVSIFGSQLSPREWKATTFPARPLQNWVTAIFSVGGQDRVANIVYESPNQLNVQVPTDLPQGFGQLKINNPTQSPNSTTPSTTIPIAVRGASPGIFTFGDNRAVVQNPNGRVNTPTEPARPGDVVVAYLTGQGPGDYLLPTGEPAPMNRIIRIVFSSRATLGGIPVELPFIGLTPGFVGLAQANIRVPAVPPGDYPLQIEIDGVKSNSAVISVGPLPH